MERTQKSVTRFDRQHYPILHALRGGRCLDDLISIEPEKPNEVHTLDGLMEKFGKASQQAELYYRVNKSAIRPFVMANHAYHADRQRIKWDRKPHNEVDFLTAHQPVIGEALDRILGTSNLPVYYIPPATERAISAAQGALIRKGNDLIPDLTPHTGILLRSDYEFEKGRVLIGFDVDATQLTIVVLLESKKNGTWIKSVANWDIRDVSGRTEGNGFVVSDARYDEEEHQTAQELLSSVLINLLFIFFFQVERLSVTQPVANTTTTRRYTSGDGQQVYDTSLACTINVIDAPWFTTITRTDPFLVRGHFRNQRYGTGRAEYKVIYIAPFQKNGYVRKAKNADVVDAPTDLTE